MSVTLQEEKRLNYEDQLLKDNPNLPFGHVPDLLQVYRQLAQSTDAVPKGIFAKKFSTLPLPRGISNSRHFCYMNAVLQALLFTPPFAQLLVAAVKESERCPNCAALGKWFLQYWQPGFTRIVVQPPVLPCFQRNLLPAAHFGTEGLMDGSVQQDAQEYLLRLLHVVSDELIALEKHVREAMAKGRKKKNNGADDDDESGGGWTVIKGKEKLNVREHAFAEGSSALLANVFGGLTESHLKGKKKNKDHVSVTVQPFFTLEVDYKDGFPQGNRSSPLDIEKALLTTFREEKIEDAKSGQMLTKTVFLKTLPCVLLLQLKRFSYNISPYDGSVTCTKDNVRFDVKRTLVIPKALCSNQTLSAEARTYKLLSVIAHLGSEQVTGHYTCYLANNFANPDHVAATRGGGGAGPSALAGGSPPPGDVVGANVVVKQSRRGRKKKCRSRGHEHLVELSTAATYSQRGGGFSSTGGL
ncbi:ubiquitin hydrolase [Strigomonas culicis]|uniref:ubiquitinyl hydrolase 1 n=1 Tax=Strigomonas culicis TaxID=28005 RepID=S9UAU0_9TRYP|nr:ubiquitin hydrolase [Strigomonas culicis]|eukprot:EPY27912.1 ubiquitin hydrolase [Strigomonas culicis]